jgi:hypothetical protein
MKQQTILTAQTMGYFRAKSEEKREVLLGELLELQEFENADKYTVLVILQAEVSRRHEVSQNRIKKAFDKIESDAAKPLSSGTDSASGHVQEYPEGNYVLTVAQNNTDVDMVALSALETFAEHNNAIIMVAKMTYNKAGFMVAQDATDGIYYDPAIVKYIVEGQISLGGVIHFIGQANVNPTAKGPLSGFESITPVGVSVCIPASKITLKATAALKNGEGKLLFSTGSITRRNYILRKAGAVAASMHNISALYVSVKNGVLTARHLEIMPGCDGFYDEGNYYSANEVITGQRPIALQFGDIHAERLSSNNLDMLVEHLEKFNPYHTVLHDVMDFSSRNHHNVKDCTFMFGQHTKGNTVEKDIIKVANVIYKLSAEYDRMTHIIESNHDLAINTWLKSEDYKADPTNAILYLQCMLELYKYIDAGYKEPFNMLEYVVGEFGGLIQDNIVFHSTDESLILAGIEMGCHGHTGANGSRGSPQQLAGLGVKMNTGHTHSPSIIGGCYTAGCCELDMGYNIGPSSWRLASIVTWQNGQRQIIFL